MCIYIYIYPAFTAHQGTIGSLSVKEQEKKRKAINKKNASSLFFQYSLMRVIVFSRTGGRIERETFILPLLNSHETVNREKCPDVA